MAKTAPESKTDETNDSLEMPQMIRRPLDIIMWQFFRRGRIDKFDFAKVRR